MTHHAGREIAKKRKARGLTQKQLGDLIGYQGDPGRTIRKIEAKAQLSPRVLKAIDRVLKDL
ncbi:helix-turn-helix transcriptional regulator [Qipengyuania gaetbuli]|uniref:helix-turn-helix transcriptional regulator n=1 Tax=Qipengyuania gaetbuli TaxID=266952 RepID=UPI001CFEC00A|nr:helix-turn-helix transcriptional regulator [Qipengyuania gaetbuli]